MSDSLINFLVALPCQLVLIYAATRLLDIRHKGWYWLASIAVLMPFLVMQDFLGQPGRMLIGTVAMIVPWLAFARDPLPRRLFASVLLLLVVVIAEIPPTLLWSHLIGPELMLGPAVEEDLSAFIAAHLLHLVVLIGLLVALEAVERWMESTSTRDGLAQFIGFIAVQYLLIAFSVGIMEVTGDLSRAVVVGNLIVAVACVVADAFFFPLMERYNLKVLEDQRAQMLALELSHYLARYEGIEREVSAVARVRHDLRNQANVALMLIDQGALARASAYADELIDRVEEVSGPPAGSLDADGGRECLEPEGAPGADEASRARRREPARLTARFLRTPRRRALVSLLFPLSQLVVLAFLTWYIIVYAPPLWVPVSVAAAVVPCVAADVMLFRALAAIDDAELATERVRLLEEQRDLQRVYFERLRDGLEEARSMRTDILAVLCRVERLLAAGEGDKAAAVIRRAVDGMDSLDDYRCENRAVGALMAMKLRACADAGIDVDCQIVVPDGLEILDVDLCALFSNLMDNAIRSCQAVEGPRRRIELKACLVSGVLLVDLVNGRAADDELPACLADVDEAEGRALLAFGERELPVPAHGWGLQILRSLAERYGGSLKTEVREDGWFHTTIMLVNERPAKNSLGGGAQRRPLWRGRPLATWETLADSESLSASSPRSSGR